MQITDIKVLNEQFRSTHGNLGFILESPLPLSQYDAIEVSPVVDDGEYCEIANDASEANLWSVYFHLRSGGVECIADFPVEHRELADIYANHISRHTGWPVYGRTKEVANG